MRQLRRLRPLALAGFVALALVACSSKGKVKEPAKLVRIEHPKVEAQRLWTRDIGTGSGKFFSALRLALGEDALYTAAVDGDVFALDPKTGAVIWRARTKARLIAGPTLAGDAVLLGTLDGEVLALKRADGSQLWRVPASSEVIAPPAAAGNTVVVKTTDGHIFGLDAADGSRQWAFDRNEPELILRGQSAPLILGNRVYLGLDNGKIVALGLDDGQLAWEQALSVPTGRSPLDRLTDIDADLLEGADGLYAVTFGGDLALVDTLTGDSRWRRSIKSYSGMALAGDKLFVTDDDGLVWGLDSSTGAASWKQDALKYHRLSAPAVAGDFVVVADTQGWLHFLAPGDGSLVGRASLGGDPIEAPPVAGSDGLLYAMDVEGRVRAFALRPPR